MNLFVSILLEAFGGDDEEEEGGDAEAGAAPAPAPAPAPAFEPELPFPQDHALFCFGPRSKARLACQRLAESSSFDSFIICLIIVSSIALALDVPRLDPESDLAYYLKQANLVFTILFTIEMLV